MKFIFWLIIFIIIASIIGCLFYFYYKVEKPLSETIITTRDINIRIIDFDTNKNIIANYTISQNNKDNIYKKGVSLSNNYIQEKLPENYTFYISSNINNISYYNSVSNPINTYDKGPFRIDLYLLKRGELYINLTHDFGTNNFFNITLYKEGELKDLNLCYSYSPRIIIIYNNNSLKETNKLPNYNNYYKCFILPNFNKTIDLRFDFMYFGILDKSDFINFLMYDTDPYNDVHKEFYFNVTKK